jgi:hypothetical protein
LNENEIEYKCAPFEAEWQLVYLEMIGEIHGMITQDSDVLVLGAKVALLDVKFHDEASKRNCAFFEFSEVFEREGPLVLFPLDGLHNCMLCGTVPCHFARTLRRKLAAVTNSSPESTFAYREYDAERPAQQNTWPTKETSK